METAALYPFLYAGFVILVLGSAYLVAEAVQVHRLFAESIIGRLVKTLVVVVLIELWSLGVVTYAFWIFYKQGLYMLLPIVAMWIMCVIYSIYAVKAARGKLKGV